MALGIRFQNTDFGGGDTYSVYVSILYHDFFLMRKKITVRQVLLPSPPAVLDKLVEMVKPLNSFSFEQGLLN